MSEARARCKEALEHMANDRLDEAVKIYRECTEAEPELALAWNGLAMALGQQGELDGAIQAALHLIELEPEEPLGHTSLSMFYMRKGMIPEAEDEKAIAMRLTMRQQGQ